MIIRRACYQILFRTVHFNLDHKNPVLRTVPRPSTLGLINGFYDWPSIFHKKCNLNSLMTVQFYGSKLWISSSFTSSPKIERSKDVLLEVLYLYTSKYFSKLMFIHVWITCRSRSVRIMTYKSVQHRVTWWRHHVFIITATSNFL